MYKSLKILSLFAVCTSLNLGLISCDSKVVDLRSNVIKSYLEAKTDLERTEIGELYNGLDISTPNLSKVIYWDDDYSYPQFKVVISENRDLSDAFIDYTYNNSYDGGVCVPGKKYYYKVIGLSCPYNYMTKEEREDPSKVEIEVVKKGSFKVKKDTVRFVDVDGMKNLRDLGGWKVDKKQIKYSMVYRGGYFKNITDFGIDTMKNKLGIVTEIDLRDPSDRPDRYEIHESYNNLFNYVEAPITTSSYIFPMWKQEEPFKRSYYGKTKESLYNAFTSLANPSNYPVYFHCNAGADRTGTFAFLLNGLLGVNVNDLFLDFELTCFAGGGTRQFRGPIVDGVRIIGVAQDDTSNYVGIGEMYLNMLKWYGKDSGAKDDSLQAAIENYLTSFIGVSENDIKSIKNIMLI